MKLFDRFGDKLIYSYSTRQGGVSGKPYDTLNLSFSMGDDPDKVRQNHAIWLGGLGVDPAQTVMLSQTHSNHVRVIDRSDCGSGLFRARIPDTDGMITNVPGVALVTGHADCVPVYLYDPVKNAIGMVHAGWRGTTAEIARVAVEALTAEYGTDPADLYAMIGPCISIRYFECDRDVINAVEEMSCDLRYTYYYNEFTGKYHVSLAELNRSVLKAAGVPGDHIDMEDVCTFANPDLYFSHRRDGLARGGQQALLMLRVPEGSVDDAAVPGQDAPQGFPDIRAFRGIVSELLDELPREFFKDLSGGVIVSETAKVSPDARANGLYALGTYTVGPSGRQIAIYYGSFKLLYGRLSGGNLKKIVRETVRHEFRHHLEFLAGMHGADSLEAEDKRRLDEYDRNRR